MQAHSLSRSASWRDNVVRFEGYSRPRTCEMLVRGRWVAVPIEEALEVHPDRLKRCCECLGGVGFAPPDADGRPAHFFHRQAHAGCSRDATFAGRRMRHPKAMT